MTQDAAGYITGEREDESLIWGILVTYFVRQTERKNVIMACYLVSTAQYSRHNKHDGDVHLIYCLFKPLHLFHRSKNFFDDDFELCRGDEKESPTGLF
jgi:hypothetical protein